MFAGKWPCHLDSLVRIVRNEVGGSFSITTCGFIPYKSIAQFGELGESSSNEIGSHVPNSSVLMVAFDVIALYMIRAIFPSWTTSYHRFMVRPTCPNQDGNCGVLYERMARALVLCSGAVPNGTPEQQASSKQRRQTAPGWENNTFFVCLFVCLFVFLFFCFFDVCLGLFVFCLVETNWRPFFFLRGTCGYFGGVHWVWIHS